MTYPTGEQYEISHGDQVAVVTEVGSALRVYRVDGRDVLLGFDETEVISGGRGQQLIPWPNRIRDGRYEFGGKPQQLALTEPARHNASHGLARHVPWTLVEHTTSSLTQEVTVFPQPGWPGILRARLSVALTPDGLGVELIATNIGDTDVPFGYGAHPYLTVGQERVDEVSVTVPASDYLVVDDRMLPASVRPVSGTEYDLRASSPIGERVLDTAFTGVHRGEDGRWRVRLEQVTGGRTRFAELWADENFGWLQVYTGADRRDIGIAIEPMTCGPDAFNPGPTHEAMIVLTPGAAFTGRWGIRGGTQEPESAS